MREGVKMRRCEDEKMRYRPTLLEEPCAQTLSGILKKIEKLELSIFDFFNYFNYLPILKGNN